MVLEKALESPLDCKEIQPVHSKGDQEGRRGSEEAAPGPSVFPSGEPGVSGDFWGSQEGCQGAMIIYSAAPS